VFISKTLRSGFLCPEKEAKSVVLLRRRHISIRINIEYSSTNPRSGLRGFGGEPPRKPVNEATEERLLRREPCFSRKGSKKA
jgi:hypothetical protein